ncbi:hypothetical protein INT48_005944 [Thamnidium elegans]|uniref:Uncharacterized protein n=1 Tax=Thamnidium elegans TaxID=101142 RepID=A0A8H7SSY0_9FUNG|nr:hypothetical protein INT48_005944 [Thamnidium elegans]
MGWVRLTVYSFIREYESESFKRSHSEEWYKAHMWHFLNTVSNNVNEMEILRSEKASFSSSKRKNKDMSIGAIDSLVSKEIGSKCDMIFRKLACNHDDIFEFGATETGKNYDGDDVTKKLIEGCIKLPKCLKDMLDNLAMNIQAIADTDRPIPYITRMTRVRSVHISSDISNFGSSVLPSMYSVWLAREIVKRVLPLLTTSPTAVSNADSSWLETYWTSSKPFVMSGSSTSSMTSNRSRKVNYR